MEMKLKREFTELKKPNPPKQFKLNLFLFIKLLK